jgi:hypothetical protein
MNKENKKVIEIPLSSAESKIMNDYHNHITRLVEKNETQDSDTNNRFIKNED